MNEQQMDELLRQVINEQRWQSKCQMLELRLRKRQDSAHRMKASEFNEGMSLLEKLRQISNPTDGQTRLINLAIILPTIDALQKILSQLDD